MVSGRSIELKTLKQMTQGRGEYRKLTDDPTTKGNRSWRRRREKQ